MSETKEAYFVVDGTNIGKYDSDGQFAIYGLRTGPVLLTSEEADSYRPGKLRKAVEGEDGWVLPASDEADAASGVEPAANTSEPDADEFNTLPQAEEAVGDVGDRGEDVAEPVTKAIIDVDSSITAEQLAGLSVAKATTLLDGLSENDHNVGVLYDAIELENAKDRPRTTTLSLLRDKLSDWGYEP